jgi:predicted metal-dependent hydrolase
MQFEFPFRLMRVRSRVPLEGWLRVGPRQVPLALVPNRRARRYVLRLRPDGTARVSIPRGGSAVEARRFAERNIAWLERQLLRQALRASRPKTWTVGSEILFRGESVRLRLEQCSEDGGMWVRFAAEQVELKHPTDDLRPAVESHLWRLAARELPARVRELASRHQFEVRRIMVRNQRSRWGSCSRHGTVSLNWRLVQTPESVRDYIILHELAHLKHMNHSRRFWAEVKRLCPDFERAETWLKGHRELLS